MALQVSAQASPTMIRGAAQTYNDGHPNSLFTVPHPNDAHTALYASLFPSTSHKDLGGLERQRVRVPIVCSNLISKPTIQKKWLLQEVLRPGHAFHSTQAMTSVCPQTQKVHTENKYKLTNLYICYIVIYKKCEYGFTKILRTKRV